MICSMPATAPTKWLRWMVGAPPRPITRFFVKLAMPITSCGTTWPMEITRSHPSNSCGVDGHRDRLGIAAVGDDRHLVGADLAEHPQPAAPLVNEEFGGIDVGAEHHRRVVVRHRDVRAERGEHADRAAVALELAA